MTQKPISVTVPIHIYKTMIEHFRQCRPMECCGILSGYITEKNYAHVTKIYPIPNIIKTLTKHVPPHLAEVIEKQLNLNTSFMMDPMIMIDVIKTIRRNQENIVSIYHSHVEGPAYPSEEDIEFVTQTCVYIIMSGSDHQEEMRGHWIDRGTRKVEHVELDIKI